MKLLGLSAIVLTVSLAPAKATSSKLVGVKWAALDNPAVFLEFDSDGVASGSGGCNRFFSSYTWDGAASLSFGPIGSTKRACFGDTMRTERKFFEVLSSTTDYVIEGKTLILKAEDERDLFRLQPQN